LAADAPIARILMSITRSARWATGGLFLGALLGYALRPSVLLIGKLPFGVVITRGATLTGVDRILVDAAARSFNMLLAGAAIGSLIGWGLTALMAENIREPAAGDDAV
jgi:hypothetical protein